MLTVTMPMRVAGERKRRIRQRKRDAAVRDAESIHHLSRTVIRQVLRRGATSITSMPSH
jgi:hypothetical protein